MLKTKTEIREITLSPFSVRLGAANLLIKSPTTRVALPTRRAEAVETSAAQSPARTKLDLSLELSWAELRSE